MPQPTRRSRHRVVASSLAALLCACAAFAAPPQTETPTPSTNALPLSLADCVRIALAQNPEIAATRHDATAAREQYRQAAGEALPTLRAVGGYTRFLDNQRLIPARANNAPGVFSENIVNGDIVLTQPLFAGGRIRNEIRAADLLRQAADHQLARSREELVFDVSSLYYAILASRHVAESLRFSQQTLDEHLKHVESLVAAEKAARVDQLRVEVRLADVRQRTVQADTTQTIQERALASLMGDAAALTGIKVAGELPSPSPATPVSVDEALKKAIRNRSDYLAARSTVEAQEKTLGVARAAHWPTVSLQGDYGGRWAADPTDHPAGAQDAEDVGWVGVVVDVPLFEGGRLDARVNEQRARLAAQQERLRKLELQVRLDVETAILNLESSRQRVLATQKAIEQAQESLRTEKNKYDVGRGAIVDVLDAQAALLESQTTYYSTLAAYSTAEAQLRLATGDEQ